MCLAPKPSAFREGRLGETQVDDQGGSILAAIMAHFLTVINSMRHKRVYGLCDARRVGLNSAAVTRTWVVTS